MMWSLMLPLSSAMATEQVSIDAACGKVLLTGGAERTEILRRPVSGVAFRGGLPCVDLQVRTAHEASVRVRSLSADLTVSDFGGELTFESVDGGLTVQATGRAPSIVRAEAASGDLHIRLAAGGEVRAESVAGSVSVRGGPAQRIDVETVSGEVRLRAALEVDAWVVAGSHSGTVIVEVDRVPSEVEVDTFSGVVDQRVVPRALSGQGPRIEAETFSGTVRVEAIK